MFVLFPVFAQEPEEGQEAYLKTGGALRLNVISENYEETPNAASTYAVLDTRRVNLDALHSADPVDHYYLPGKAGHAVPLNEVKWNYRFNINIGYYL